MISIYLTDSERNYDQAQEYFQEAFAWAQSQCKSFVGFDVQDTADVSYEWDQVAVYNFSDERDAQWFSLKWK